MDSENRTTAESGASLYRALVESCPDAIVVADREGVIRFRNAGAEATFGHTAAEAAGKSLDLIHYGSRKRGVKSPDRAAAPCSDSASGYVWEAKPGGACTVYPARA